MELYRNNAAHAVVVNELDAYRASWQYMCKARKAIEDAIKADFDGMHLDRNVVDDAIEAFGERDTIELVAACTVLDKFYDGRFSKSNKEWASNYDTEWLIDNSGKHAHDRRWELSCDVHPAVMNGFVDLLRKH